MADKYTETRYNRAPTVNHPRTQFDLSHNRLLTCNTGDFVPCLAEPIFPGDTVKLDTASLTRLATSLHQTMDQAYIEFAFFFVPNIFIWDNFDKFLGANDDPWAQEIDFTIPQLKLGLEDNSDIATVSPGSLLNHLALPAGDYGSDEISSDDYMSIDILPLRAVFQVYNDWFRDENYDSIVYFDKGDYDSFLGDQYVFNGDYFDPASSILKVNRFKDVFSTALPAPQKGQEVTISPYAGLADVILKDNLDSQTQYQRLLNKTTGQGVNSTNFASGNVPLPLGVTTTNLDPNGTLAVNLGEATAVTINQLRIAIVTQAMAERDARSGTRLPEKIYSTWNVKAPSLELGRSEFLGGKRIPITMMEVLQTSETGQTVLGSDAGHSKTLDRSESFIKSFTDYGWLLGFVFMRTNRTYSQGIDRKFRNKSKYDLYDPMMDNIGELAVLKQELYAIDLLTPQDLAAGQEVFGYQEPWYHLKERLSRTSGYYQPGINGTLDSWHYGDNYNQVPSAGSSWLKEGAENVDRTISVQQDAPYSYQWEVDIHFDLKITREMKKYPVPNTFGFGY